MFIENYGLFWKREDVFWGTTGPGNAGTLLGKEINQEPVDFREQFGVYALYNRNKALLYCGLAGIGKETEAEAEAEAEVEIQTLFERIQQHQQDGDPLSEFWTYFSWFGIKSVERLNETDPLIEGDRIEFLNQIKAIMIQLANPAGNKNPANFNPAIKYEQHRP